MKSIYRRFKDYIQKDDNSSTVIFGSLLSSDCCYVYEDEKGEWHEWTCRGMYWHDMDFLLNYYVVGIHPQYKIENDKIISYLRIILEKEKPE